jgi:hypothetical protein
VEDVTRRRRWGTLALLWAATIFGLSSIPGQSLPGPGFKGLDKIVHFVVFAVLAALLARAWRRLGPAVLVAILWGILDELHQRYTPNRESSVYDALADTIGAVCGAALALWLATRQADRERRRRHGDRT